LGPSIDQDGAGATLALSATVFGSGQVKILAQHSQKTDLSIRLDRAGTSVDSKLNRSHATPPTREPSKNTLRPFAEMIHGVERHFDAGRAGRTESPLSVPSLRKVSQKSRPAYQKLASRQNRDFAGDY
jgi:hypothetical protein